MSNADHDREIDDVTGVETTGHQWDGIKELNKPLPKWWLYTFYATIIWAIGYWILYPAFPLMNGYTQGILGYSQRAVVAESVRAGKEGQAQFREQIANAELEEIGGNQDLLRFAMAGGAASFGENCAGCHGRGAQGFVGYPNLNDDDWIWGGSLPAIYQTIRYGIRNGHDEARYSDMPRFGLDGLLEPDQINDVASYVMSLSGQADDPAAAERGSATFAEQCSVCHGDNGEGIADLGAPNLTDAISLYGSDKASIVESIQTGRGGVMPAWDTRLDDVTIKSLAVYVHALGGGE